MAHVAIIGAGVAGLAAAGALQAAGARVTVFEKSRGVGGRMATRRADEWQFDHGAQYVSARGAAFALELDRWRAAGVAAEWFEGAFVGAPRMTAPARLMSEGLHVVTQALVTGLEHTRDGWLLSADGADGAQRYDSVVVATPAPQAAPLLASAGVAFPRLGEVSYAPCWALMAAFDHASPAGPDYLAPDDEPLAWIARDSGKPGRDATRAAYVAHATAAWTRTRLEDTPDAVTPDLLACLMRLTGAVSTPSYVSAHRWRFALVEHPLGEPCLFDPSRMIGACGDWCLGARVEAAYDSGRAMGAAITAAIDLS